MAAIAVSLAIQSKMRAVVLLCPNVSLMFQFHLIPLAVPADEVITDRANERPFVFRF
jgi:hypothetical protein